MMRLRWLVRFLVQEQPWTPALFLGGVSFLIMAHFLGIPL